MFFAPPNAALKVSATFTAMLLPDPETDDPPALRVHWLFCKLVAARGVVEQPQRIRIPVVIGVTASRKAKSRVEPHVVRGQVRESVGVGKHEAERLARPAARGWCDGNHGRRWLVRG